MGEIEDDDQWRPDPGWGPLTFRGMCLAWVLGSLGVIAAVVLGYVGIATETFVPGPGPYGWGPQAQPNYGAWTILVLPGAAIFALLVMFYALLQVVRLREVEPFTRAYKFEFRAERKDRGLVHTVALGVLSAVIRHR